MRDLLLVLNPREIEECLASIRELPIDKLWIRRLREHDIQERWPEILELASDYDRLTMIADDAIVRSHALEAVLSLHAEHPVVTGYSNLSLTDYRVNLTKTPLGDVPGEDAYNLYDLSEVMAWSEPTLPTFLTGYTLLCMSHAMWQRFPFEVYGDWPGWASDFHVSKRLTREGVPIVAAREGFCFHTKEKWNHRDVGRRELVNGPAELELECA